MRKPRQKAIKDSKKNNSVKIKSSSSSSFSFQNFLIYSLATLGLGVLIFVPLLFSSLNSSYEKTLKTLKSNKPPIALKRSDFQFDITKNIFDALYEPNREKRKENVKNLVDQYSGGTLTLFVNNLSDITRTIVDTPDAELSTILKNLRMSHITNLIVDLMDLWKEGKVKRDDIFQVVSLFYSFSNPDEEQSRLVNAVIKEIQEAIKKDSLDK